MTNAPNQSGQAPFAFTHRTDLRTLPQSVLEAEVNLHGGFAIDERAGFGHIYYGMPGCGILRIDPDMTKQALITLPDELTPLNFHSTKIGEFDGQQRLFLPANMDEMVAVISLEGKVDFVLPRPEFEEYQSPEAPFKPTDVVLDGDQLIVADGYGSNYILSADMASHEWTSLFGGKTESAEEDGKFATAHGLNLIPSGDQLAIADRPSARIQIHDHHHGGAFIQSHKLPPGSWPCGINYLHFEGRSLAVIGNLRAPVEGQPAPIYILDASTYEVLSTIRPKEELGIELAQHIHNTIAHVQDGQLYLICQAWNPGYYFVLERV